MPAPKAQNLARSVVAKLSSFVSVKKQLSSLSSAASELETCVSSISTSNELSEPFGNNKHPSKKNRRSSSVADSNVISLVSSISTSNQVSKAPKATSTPTLADLDLISLVSSISTSNQVSKAPPPSSGKATSSLHDVFTHNLNTRDTIADDEAAEELSTTAIKALEELKLDCEDEHEHKSDGVRVKFPWLDISSCIVSPRRHEIARERKQRWVYKSETNNSFDKLVKKCGRKFGAGTTIDLFGKLKSDSGPKEYTGIIHMCIEKARAATDEDVSFDQFYQIHQLFRAAQENGFNIQEEMYREVLLYLIEFGMIQEFFFFHQIIIDGNPESFTRLAYYEMLLWVSVGNEVKIQELYRAALADDSQEKSHVQENLLMALCKSDKKEEFLMLLQALDITKVTSVSCLQSVFGFLGKFSLETVAEQSIQALKNSSADIEGVNISNFICEYAISIPNISVEDTIIKFQTLHAKLEVLPTSAQYKKLIKYLCTLQKVHEAIKIAEEAFDSGVSLSLETYHLILEECIQSCELNPVHQVRSMISRHNLEPDSETFRLMINLYVQMKDFVGACGLINDMVEGKLKPTTCIYNILLAGFFREKNMNAARNVLKEMEYAGVKPDDRTFSYLIANSTSQKDIIKFYEQSISAGVPPTKKVFTALINAYAACGQFEKAKEVVLDTRIPRGSLNEINSALVAALASKGQFSSAFDLYENMKKFECDVGPIAKRNLIEHFGPEGDLDKMLQLLEEINGSPYWIDSCFKVIWHCLKQENLRYALDLIKQLMDNFDHDHDVIFDEVFYVLAEKTDMQFGLSLLKAIKEELGVTPPRKALDFLLSGCANSKDAKASFVIWKEYELAGLPYNVLCYLRMYQALLASGDTKSAAEILNSIPKDDPHVRCVVSACAKTYGEVKSVTQMKEVEEEKKKSKKKNGGKLKRQARKELIAPLIARIRTPKS